MKIGVYSPYLDTLTGGELYIFSIVDYLSKKNDVTVFWNDSNILKKASERFGLALNNVKVKSNVFDQNKSLSVKFLRTMTYDRIIYLSDGSVPLLLPRKMLVHFQFPILRKNVSISEIRKVKLARSIFCNSEFTKGFIDKTYGVNSHVIYPPVSPINFIQKDKQNVILTVGRYQPLEDGQDFKRISFMIDLFKEISLKGWKLVVVTSVKKEYEDRFDSIKKEEDENIRILKNVSRSKIEEAYREAKIYWHAAGFGEDINSHPERAEHFGISTVEAMSAGCVPIVIKQGGQKEIVDNASGFLWSDEEELRAYTLKVANDDNLRMKLAKEAEKKSQEFNVEKFRNKLDILVK